MVTGSRSWAPALTSAPRPANERPVSTAPHAAAASPLPSDAPTGPNRRRQQGNRASHCSASSVQTLRNGASCCGSVELAGIHSSTNQPRSTWSAQPAEQLLALIQLRRRQADEGREPPSLLARGINNKGTTDNRTIQSRNPPAPRDPEQSPPSVRRPPPLLASQGPTGSRRHA